MVQILKALVSAFIPLVSFVLGKRYDSLGCKLVGFITLFNIIPIEDIKKYFK